MLYANRYFIFIVTLPRSTERRLLSERASTGLVAMHTVLASRRAVSSLGSFVLFAGIIDRPALHICTISSSGVRHVPYD